MDALCPWPMRITFGLTLLSCSLFACGGSAPPPVVEPPSYAEPGAAEPAPAPPPVATAAPAPSPEELKKAEEKKKLEQDFAKLETDRQAELSRLTPELKKAAQALADMMRAAGEAAEQRAREEQSRLNSNP